MLQGEEAANEVGLYINPKKTEFMTFGEEHGLAHPRQTSKFERQKLGQHSIECMSSGSLLS